MSGAILAFIVAFVAYFVAATAVGICTGYDPFQSTTPRLYRVFLYVAAKIWNKVLPGIGGLD